MAIQGDFGKILCGLDIPVEKCNIAIHQPTVRDICAYGEDNFFGGVELFVHLDKVVSVVRQGNPRLSHLSDFQILMIIIEEDAQMKALIEEFFDLILNNYSFEFKPGSIEFFFKENNSHRMVGQLNPMNYEYFQDTIKLLFLIYGAEETKEYNPANKKAEEIAAKLKKGNEIRKSLEQKKASAVGSLLGNQISCLSIGLGLPVHCFLDYTPFQLYDAFLRYQKKSAFDLYQKVATTPMMDVSKMKEPDSWLENIYK